MTQSPRWIGDVLAAIFSILAGFFATFNVLFSDVFGVSAMAQAVLFVLIVYATLAAVLTFFWSASWRRWSIWLSVPALLATLLSLGDNLERLGYTMCVVLAACLGSLLASLGMKALRK